MSDRQLSLNLHNPWGGSAAGSWRYDGSEPGSAWSVDWLVGVAKEAERGLFDAVFMADTQGLNDFSPTGGQTVPEPITLLSTVAAHTEYVGVAGTVTTTYTEPYNTARQLASLDQLSGGRVGWNAVTGSQPAVAPNFGAVEHPSNEDRYERADEFIEIVKALWDSWDADAVVADKESGIYLDTSKVRRVPFQGKHFDLNALFNVPRSPQGAPMIFHAGSSDTGRNQGAKYADGIFTAQPNIEAARAFYADVKTRVAAFGRNPDHVKVCAGILPVIGSTEAEAQAYFEQLNQFFDVDNAVAFARQVLQLELGDVDFDAPIPELVWQGGLNGSFTSRVAALKLDAQEKGLTARQLLQRMSASFGHHLVVGTPEHVADDIELWFTTGATDGFNYKLPEVPGSLTVFIDEVLPLLQRKGIFRKEYTEKTLRGHYGLPIDTRSPVHV